MVAFTKHDLQFILDGIIVSETHADQTNDTTGGVWTPADIETSREVLLSLVPNSFEPIGMRTISGELNNLVQDQGLFGATGEFPRLLDPNFIDDGATGNPADSTAFGPGTNTNYQESDGPSNTSGTDGNVVDSDPRIISNLIVDQSLRNPAAVSVAVEDAGLDGIAGTEDDILIDGAEVINPDGSALYNGDEFYFIANTAPDEGLSAPFNGWMTFFGQFFDHGLDLVDKGNSGTIFIPLQADDPLVTLGQDGIAGTGDEIPAGTPLILSRATVDPGPDGLLGTADDVADANNKTSPFVDQNQTYTSHPSHQIFMREYEAGPNGPVATGALIEGVVGGLATWGDVKDQANTLLGIELTDLDGLNIPLFAVDQYGEYLRGVNGLPQYVLADGSLVEGQIQGDGTGLSVAEAEALAGQSIQRTGFSFLLDIAHAANPVNAFGVPLTRHEDGDPDGGPPLLAGEYDGDLFDAHFVAGDGRANENIALTAVHHVFHQEHNRLVEHTKAALVTVAGSGDVPDAVGLLQGFLTDPLPPGFQFINRNDFAAGPAGDAAFDAAVQATVNLLSWDGDRLFQTAKFGTEMQYQHLVFEEFGRKVQPLIDLFASFEGTVDASIVAEFAHTVYRFGHSMLTEDVAVMNADGTVTDVGLIEAFLNPLGFHQDVLADGSVVSTDALNAEEIAGGIVRGMTRIIGNEIDEFVTDSLRNNLLGLPLDLAAINIARGRETGIPSLNEARAQFFAGTGDTKLKPYESWFDFALNLKHEASIINFIAAYGQHSTITGATTLEDKRDAAFDLVVAGAGSPADRLDFLNSTGAWANQETGLNLVDFWIGGLAESIEPFGGMLGSTFNFVFEDQMERLQDGDRFYYLGRTAGLNFVTQLEQNSFAAMIVRNTDIGDGPGDHLPGDIFSTPNYILEIDPALQVTGINPGVDGVGRDDPTGDSILIPLVIRDDPNTAADESVTQTYLRYTGGDHVVLGGSDADETLIGGIGDDTLWGEGGDDNLEGGDGGDIILGGDGDDIITDIGGPNNLQGQGGNDAIFAGGGESLILAGDGKDFVLQGPDLAETFGGQGDDFIHLGSESNIALGGEGNDWMEGGGGNNLLQGDNADPFLNSTITGHDVFLPGLGDDDYDSESGDDVMVGGIGVQRFEGVNGFDWATYFNDVTGVDADMFLRAFDETPIPPSPATIMDRFDSTEGLSGSAHGDILRASDDDELVLRTTNNGGDHVLRNFDLIQGLRAGDFGGAFDANALFAAGTTEWAGGNIILGGAGSDLIEGRGGDDIIDGDLVLGVRLLVRDPITNVPIATADRMQGELYAVDPLTGNPVLDVNGDRVPVNPADFGGATRLHEAVFSRGINPGDIHILREIVDGGSTDFDTAVFSGNLSEYTVEGSGTANGFADIDLDGFIRVTHDAAGADGSDLLRNIERLQFADQALQVPGLNSAPTGMPGIVIAGTAIPVTSPSVGQQIEATLGTIADADGLPALLSQFSFTWQFEEEPGSGVFVDFEVVNGSGEVGPLEGQTITVPEEALGFALRVQASFQDGNGVIETVFSDSTEIVANAVSPVATNGDDLLIGTTGNDVIDALAGDDEVFALAGIDVVTGGPGNDILDGGLGFDIAVFDGNFADFEFALDPEGNLEVVDPITGEEDVVINFEALSFNDQTVLVDSILNPPNQVGTNGADILEGTEFSERIDGLGGADEINGNGGDDDLRGNGGADIIDGGDGNDIIRGGGGADEIIGGPGDDDVRAGGGNDIIFWEAGDGRDIINGQGNGGVGDTFDLTGDGIAETFRIYAVSDPTVVLPPILGPLLNTATTIVITRDDGLGEAIIAELRNIEELVINTQAITSPPGADPEGDTIQLIGDFTGTGLNLNTITINGSFNDDTVDISQLTSDHRVVFRSEGGEDRIIGDLRPQDVVELIDGASMSDNGDGSSSISGGATVDRPAPGLDISSDDITELLNIVRGLPSDNLEDPINGTGIRDLEGTGNNLANPDFGSADQPFIRLTDARYGDPIEENGEVINRALNPIFDGLDPRSISNILGDHADAPAADPDGVNVFFNAFGQYFDHGLDFLTKGGHGSVDIGGPGFSPAPGADNPVDLTRGEVIGFDADGNPIHKNQTSPFVDQNQAYGSTELVGQFVRNSDGNGGFGSDLLAGKDDPANPNFKLLPTLGEVILHHWNAGSEFSDPAMFAGTKTLQEMYPTLVDSDGNIDADVVAELNGNFMGSGHPILLDTNPLIPLTDHFVAGDGRANENVTLTSMHNIWAREHNRIADELESNGFLDAGGSVEELFQAAKIINVAQYQRVVYDEFADALLGGMKGSGSHGFDDYNPDVDARISHEFAGAAYRFGHSLLAETVTIINEDGELEDVSLVSAFLNPTNAAGPGFAEIGVAPILGGIVTQAAEVADHNVVDAIRDNLVRLPADLFSFNVARGRDLGLGTLNQVKQDLQTSSDPYVREAIERGVDGDELRAYSSWNDFQTRNDLSNDVIAQFKEAYPDLDLNDLTQAERDAFHAANPDIALVDGHIVQGIDRVDFWLGGLVETAVNGGVVGETFWVVLHEQLDRLQEGDRFYYLDQVDSFDFYDAIEDQTFADIIARNTGLTDLPEDIFFTTDQVPGNGSTDSGTGDGTDDTGDMGDNGGTDDTTPNIAPTVGPQVNLGDLVTNMTMSVSVVIVLSQLLAGASDPDGESSALTVEDLQLAAGSLGTLVDNGDGTWTYTAEAGDMSVANFTYRVSDGIDSTVQAASLDLLAEHGAVIEGTADANSLIGTEGDDLIAGHGSADLIAALGGDDVVDGGEGGDNIVAGDGADLVFGSGGNDRIFGNDGDDMIFGDDGDDRIWGEGGDDVLEGGSGTDSVDGGADNDVILATFNDGDDMYFGGTGTDTYDLSGTTAGATVNLVSGTASSDQTGSDVLTGFENVVGSFGEDQITANNAANVMTGGLGDDAFIFGSSAAADGDHITDFQPGDRIDLTMIDANTAVGGDQEFQLISEPAFTSAGQIMFSFTSDGGNDLTLVQGNVSGGSAADFTVQVTGHVTFSVDDFLGVQSA